MYHEHENLERNKLYLFGNSHSHTIFINYSNLYSLLFFNLIEGNRILFGDFIIKRGYSMASLVTDLSGTQSVF